jgi:hypothetical protein
MEILDLKKDLKYLYSPSAKTPQLVDVPRMNFIRIDGDIEPGLAPGTSPLFRENMQALYGAAYTLKFMLKLRPVDPVSYPVMALEGLWWVKDGHFDIRVTDNMAYTVQIYQPDLVTQEIFTEALAQMRKKKGDLECYSRLRYEPVNEGLSVQMMHIGPYATELETTGKMEAFAESQGMQMAGLHHEIYLGNPVKADPSKLKTILRHPVEKAVAV